ncbi:ankyrin repeat-containing protein, partial [Tanacetum coccineum]
SRNSTSIDQVNPISKEHHVDIPIASCSRSAQALPLNLPCRDLLDEGRREEYVKICLPLYLASRKGDWKTAKDILDKHKELVRFSITKNCETALHVAVSRQKTKFVKNLLEIDMLEWPAYFCKKTRPLSTIPTSLGMMPLHVAASYERGARMVKFLYKNSQSMEGDFWTPESRSRFLLACVEADYFALQLLRSMLKNIAKLPWPEVYDLMRGPADPINKEKTATNPIDTPNKYSSRVLFLAAEVANIVFIVEIIRQYPELLTDVNDVNQSIFHVALSHRHENIFSLFYKIGSIKDRIITLEDKNGNNMLHLVGIFTESARSNCYNYIPGPAQLMQKEQLLFKLVQRMLPLSLRKKKNAAGMTPHEEFIKNHKDLVSDGEKWIKDTGSQLIYHWLAAL